MRLELSEAVSPLIRLTAWAKENVTLRQSNCWLRFSSEFSRFVDQSLILITNIVKWKINWFGVEDLKARLKQCFIKMNRQAIHIWHLCKWVIWILNIYAIENDLCFVIFIYWYILNIGA